MDIIDLTLNKGSKTTIHGKIYGLVYEIEEDNYYLKIFSDYYNRRLKVLDYSGNNYEGMAEKINYIAQENEFDKVFIKGSSNDWEKFMSYGYVIEGIFKYYYNGENAYSLSKFFSSQRRNSGAIEKENEIIESIRDCELDESEEYSLNKEYNIRTANKNDIPKIVGLYDKVFRTYPIPLNSESYVETLMDNNVLFIIIEHGDKIISSASADMDIKHKNAEMTDCATDPDYRGEGLMTCIIKELQKEMRSNEMVCLYSLARSISFGMNKVFKKLGYSFTGRLINNCNISGSFEDVNLWVKKL